MGAERFDQYQNGTDVKAAHSAAFDQAGYDYGHRGYTGSLAEKPTFEMRNGGKALTLKEAKAFADKDLEENDHDKWGPAWVVPVRAIDGERVVGFLFYGYASS
jgi:hypothetical protein